VGFASHFHLVLQHYFETSSTSECLGFWVVVILGDARDVQFLEMSYPCHVALIFTTLTEEG
jgi:hypothetical protein